MKNRLAALLERKTRVVAESRPLIFDPKKLSDRRRVEKLLRERKVREVVDDFEEQLKELFAIRNPRLVYTPRFEKEYELYLASLRRRQLLYTQGRWAYFPWRSTLVHILKDDEFQLVRTARNRNLITEEEQKKFYEATIGIAGLSVGNSVALAIVLQGGGRRIRLADHDRFALSNMNRIRAGTENLGLNKAEMTARQIYEINPYAKVELFLKGLNEKSIKRFFNGPPKLDIVIDEIDNLAIKFLIREQARKHRIAVVMAADNGDNGVVDIERYDLNPKTRFFHGRMGKVSYSGLKQLTHLEIGKLITKWVGVENISKRMQESLLDIGKTVVSWPQLGDAALMNGAAVAYCVRRILNRQPLNSNRTTLSLDEKFIPRYNSLGIRKKRRAKAARFQKTFGI